MKKGLVIFCLFFCVATWAHAQTGRSISGANPDKIVSFYPNPAVAFIRFNVVSQKQTIYSLHIFNFVGKRMTEVQGLTSNATVNLQDYLRGIYIYQLRDQYGRVLESGKFQVVK
ncbi:MAG: T9SS type A sorting domain-containing protein [Ferruginibacter sp.]